MNQAVLLLCMLNLIGIGLLPKFFFRKDGHCNLMWWVTALPFLLCALFLLLALGGVMSPFRFVGWSGVLALVAVPVSVASVALMFFTLGTHRMPLALWHQDNDTPGHIVTYGAYRCIRHPFYASFLLALLGVLIFAPHWVTLYAFGHAYLLLHITAAREEARLSVSEFGAAYQDYMRCTGRFWPRWTTRRPGQPVRELP